MTKILLSILIFPCLIYGQSDYIKINGFYDQSIIQKIRKESNTDEKILIYQPASDSFFTSILIIQGISVTSFWVIKDDSVLWRGSSDVGKIFRYKNLLQTGATKREDKLKFVPPLIGGIETALVIYEDSLHSFYFEVGKNVTGYIPDPALEIYRKEWLNIIRSELNSILNVKK